MTHDVTQWLNEIKSLQQQLAETQQQRDAAIESASQWRERYNMEGQQRRQEAQETQAMLTALKAEIQTLKSYHVSEQEQADAEAAIQAEVVQLTTVAALQSRLKEVMLERDQLRIEVNRLMQALQREQEEHIHTRNSLTIALGDTVDLLTKAQGGQKPGTPLASEGTTQAGGNTEQDGEATGKTLNGNSPKPFLRLPEWPGDS